MSLISLKQALAHAQTHNYALGAFNVHNFNLLHAIIAAGKNKRSPLIINVAEVHLKYAPIEEIAPLVKMAARRADIPIVLNLDHGLNFDTIIKAIQYGFTSVMFDGSTLSYEDNLKQTQEIVKIAHAVNVSVEAELGAVGGDEGGGLYGMADEKYFTDPKLAKIFVQETNVDCLAVAIGNAHGLYKGQPKLDFDRLKEISLQTKIPLVLHGGSGLSENDFKKAIDLGIRKINFYTGMSQPAIEALQESLKNPNPGYDLYAQALFSIEKPVQKIVEEQIEIFGSSHKC